ncbi:MAG: HXXEE domain-containing protein [Saccharothrix sp.]|nr:HXXEE domain-containing protein [Saccharothrix sp.]
MVSKRVTWGLLAAWVVHDLEELATMSRWSRKNRVLPTTPAQSAIAIGLMGGIVTAAAAAGARSGGRSRFFQTVLTGFGLHSATHLAASAVFRGYTPGVLTAPTVVAPFTLWALRRLRAEGIRPNTSPAALMWFPIAVGTVHGIARFSTRVRENTAELPNTRR